MIEVEPAGEFPGFGQLVTRIIPGAAHRLVIRRHPIHLVPSPAMGAPDTDWALPRLAPRGAGLPRS
jgi:hypothetical protein